MRQSFYEGFDFFMGLLILIFILWESEYSKIVIIMGASIICLVSIFGIFFDRDIAKSKVDRIDEKNVGAFGIESPFIVKETLKKAEKLEKV